MNNIIGDEIKLEEMPFGLVITQDYSDEPEVIFLRSEEDARLLIESLHRFLQARSND